MRGLALKIFLSFWLIHAVLFVVFAVTPNEGPDMRLVDHARHDAAIAASLLEARGADSCVAFVETTAARTGLQLQLSDAGGTRVCPPSQPTAAPSGTPVRLSLTSPGGQVYQVDAVADETFNRRFGNRPPPYGVALLLILISGLVCFGVARYLSRPLLQMRAATVRLAAGDLNTRVEPQVGRRHDEIGDLVRDFDAMAGRIEMLVDSQRQLLSDISHELRSPLARLHVALELARRKAGPPAEADLDRIEFEADRMNDLIGRVLALARAEQSGEHVARPVDIAGIVRHVAEDADYEAQRQHKAVAVTVETEVVVNGDPELLASAIDNVLRNAVRHTHEGTTIGVTVAVTASDAIVTVRDHGAGVPESELERIFTPFHRLDVARNRDAGGVGLGLAIARRALAVHGGSITAANAPGGGLCVTLRVPAAMPAGASTDSRA